MSQDTKQTDADLTWEELATRILDGGLPLRLQEAARARLAERLGPEGDVEACLAERARSPIPLGRFEEWEPSGVRAPWTSPDAMDADAHWRIETETGSLYEVARDTDGLWWFRGDNVTNRNSAALPDGWHRIARPDPWPIRTGTSVRLVSPYAPGTEGRIAGGGKHTSLITRVDAVGDDETPAD